MRPRRTRTLPRSALALVLLLLAAGCGGEEPAIQRELAGQLAARSLAAAAHIDMQAFCAARGEVTDLQERTIAAINGGRIPAELHEELLGSVNALVDGVTCTPPAATESALEDARDLAQWLRERSD